jgi:uncharacterized damage-inducible protein DinB
LLGLFDQHYFDAEFFEPFAVRVEIPLQSQDTDFHHLPSVYTLPVTLGKELLINDVSYSGWANRRLLEGCSVLTGEELERDLGISHSSVLATLRHICDGEKVWLDCLATTADLGSWRLPPGPAPELSFDDLQRQWPKLWEGYRRWIENVAENSLSVELTVQLPSGVEPRFSRWQILRHVLEHSTFHRGQIVAMIRALGHKPPAINRMDYYLAGKSAIRKTF